MPGGGEDKEVTLSRILLDLEDNHNDRGDDGVAYGHQALLDLWRDKDVIDLSTAYHVLIDSIPVAERAQKQAQIGWARMNSILT